MYGEDYLDGLDPHLEVIAEEWEDEPAEDEYYDADVAKIRAEYDDYADYDELNFNE